MAPASGSVPGASHAAGLVMLVESMSRIIFWVTDWILPVDPLPQLTDGIDLQGEVLVLGNLQFVAG